MELQRMDASLLAGDRSAHGKVHALVKDRHRSREFVEFLKLLMPLPGRYGRSS